MVRANRFIGSYLKADDFPTSQSVTINECRAEEMQGDEFLVMYFFNITKGLRLNATNINMCTVLYGTDETEAWNNQEIVIYVDPHVPYQGKLVKGLRLKKPEVHNTVNPPQGHVAQPIPQPPSDVPASAVAAAASVPYAQPAQQQPAQHAQPAQQQTAQPAQQTAQPAQQTAQPAQQTAQQTAQPAQQTAQQTAQPAQQQPAQHTEVHGQNTEDVPF